MTDRVSAFQIVDASLDLNELPFFCLDVGRNRFSGKERLRTSRPLREGVQTLLRFGVDPDGESLCHRVCTDSVDDVLRAAGERTAGETAAIAQQRAVAVRKSRGAFDQRSGKAAMPRPDCAKMYPPEHTR